MKRLSFTEFLIGSFGAFNISIKSRFKSFMSLFSQKLHDEADEMEKKIKDYRTENSL